MSGYRSAGRIAFLCAAFAAGSAWAEEFSNANSWSGVTFTNSGWTFSNPNGGAGLVEAGEDDITRDVPLHRGEVRFVVSGANNSDDQSNTRDYAPRLLKEPLSSDPFFSSWTNKDWLIETAILNPNTAEDFDGGFHPTSALQSHAGLLLWKDASNWILWGRHANDKLQADGAIGGVYMANMASTTIRAQYFRIVKTTRPGLPTRYTFYYSNIKYAWLYAGHFDDAQGRFATGAKYGLMAKSWGSDYRVQFPYFYECVPQNELDDFVSTTGAVDPLWLTSWDSQFASNVEIDRGTTSAPKNLLKLTVGAGADYWVGNPDAPKALKWAKYDDWVIDTEVVAGGTGTACYGLMVYRDDSNWIQLAQIPASNATLVNGVLGGVGDTLIDSLSSAGLPARLRITKKGNTYTFHTSTDAKTWNPVGGGTGQWTDNLNRLTNGGTQKVRYGMMAKSYGTTPPAYAATFEFFRECAAPNGVAKGVNQATQVAQITGAASINNTEVNYNLVNCDLGSMVEWGGELYMMFGDNHGRTGNPPPNEFFPRPNALAVMNDTTPDNGMTFGRMILTAPGSANAKAVIPYVVQPAGQDFVERTVIPTNGVAVNGNLYYSYMGVYKWSPAASHWDTTVTRLAKWNPSTELFDRLNTSGKPAWLPESNFVQHALVNDPNSNYVYIWGSPAGAFGGIKLARVAKASFETATAYEYWNGTGWTTTQSAARLVVPGPVREFSVQFSAYLNRWVLMALNDNTRDIELREAPNPEGPWSNGITAVDHTSSLAMKGTESSYIYGGYMAPRFMNDPANDKLYFALTKWNGYQVFWDRITLLK